MSRMWLRRLSARREQPCRTLNPVCWSRPFLRKPRKRSVRCVIPLWPENTEPVKLPVRQVTWSVVKQELPKRFPEATTSMWFPLWDMLLQTIRRLRFMWLWIVRTWQHRTMRSMQPVSCGAFLQRHFLILVFLWQRNWPTRNGKNWSSFRLRSGLRLFQKKIRQPKERMEKIPEIPRQKGMEPRKKRHGMNRGRISRLIRQPVMRWIRILALMSIR